MKRLFIFLCTLSILYSACMGGVPVSQHKPLQLIYGMTTLVNPQFSDSTINAKMQEKAAQGLQEFRDVYQKYLQGTYINFPYVNVALSNVCNQAGALFKQYQTAKKLKPRHIRQLARSADNLIEKIDERLAQNITEQERGELTSLKKTILTLRVTVFDTRLVKVGTRRERIVDFLYHRPKEFLWATRVISVPIGTILAMLTFKKMTTEKDEPRSSLSFQTHVINGKKISMAKSGELTQVKTHNQFATPVSTLCQSSVFCGGLALVLGRSLRDVDTLPDIYDRVNDYSYLEKVVPPLLEKIGKTRVDFILGVPPHQESEHAIKENGVQVGQWLQSSDAKRMFGSGVIDYIKKYSEVIKAVGLDVWGGQTANGKTHRENLERLTQKDWVDKYELDIYTAEEADVNALGDPGVERRSSTGDAYYFFSHENSSTLQARINDYVLSGKKDFAPLNRLALKLYNSIVELRNNGTPQIVILSYTSHWVCCKISRNQNNSYSMIIIDTANTVRVSSTTVRNVFNLYTKWLLPERYMMEYYTQFSIKETALYALLDAFNDSEGEQQNQNLQAVVNLIQDYIAQWLEFKQRFAGHKDARHFANSFKSAYSAIRRFYRDNLDGKIEVKDGSGAIRNVLDFSSITKEEEFMTRYQELLEG